GSTTYYVSQVTAAGCESPRAPIVVNVTALPAAPTVTTPVAYCVGDAATALNATAAAGNTLLWWGTSATGGTSSPTAPTPSTATPGSTTYYVSQVTAAGCESPRASIVVNVTANPLAPTVTTPVAYCVGQTATALSATASAGNSLLWWGTSSTGGTSSATGPSPSTATAGSTTYYVSQVTAAGCESPRASIVVNVTANPAAPKVTTPVAYCVVDAATALNATAAAGNTLLWWGTSATGGTSSPTAPTPSTATPGSTKYYVSQVTAAGCESPRAPIVVNVTALPAAPTVTTPVAYCVG